MSLLDVTPCTPADDRMYLTDAHAEVSRDGTQFLSLCPPRSDGSNIPRYEFGRTMPTLHIAVPHVGGVIPDKEVVGSCARGIVTDVADIQSFGYWAVVNGPPNAMGHRLGGLSSWPRSQDAITELGRGTDPAPASDLLYDDLLPVPLLQAGHDLVLSRTADGAEPSSALVPDRSGDFDAAAFAGVGDGGHATIIPKVVA